jgi:hypothetical protein
MYSVPPVVKLVANGVVPWMSECVGRRPS